MPGHDGGRNRLATRVRQARRNPAELRPTAPRTGCVMFLLSSGREYLVPGPFKAQCNGGFQSALFRVEALVAVPLHAEKLNMLPGLGALLGTGRSGSPIRLRHIGDGRILMGRQIENRSWCAVEVL